MICDKCGGDRSEDNFWSDICCCCKAMELKAENERLIEALQKIMITTRCAVIYRIAAKALKEGI